MEASGDGKGAAVFPGAPTGIGKAFALGLALAAAACAPSAGPTAPDEPAPAAAAAPAATGAAAVEKPFVFDDDTSQVIGHPAPAWRLERWFNSPPVTVESLRGSVVLVRWFMSPDCPLCSATAPSLNRFHEQYKERGLTVIGMYHHKDEKPLDPEDVRRYVDHFKFRFPVAIDADWGTLKRWWLDGHEKRKFTSVSFLIDRKGIVRHVHLGGRYAPGEPDYDRVQGWIETLLAEPPG